MERRLLAPAWMPLLLYSVKNPFWTAILVVFMAWLRPTVANTAFEEMANARGGGATVATLVAVA